MPKTKIIESALHEWVHELTFQQQALLMTGMRGPDENNKYNIAKGIVRYLRGAICKPAGNWSGLNDNDFMWGDYKGPNGFDYYAEKFWQDHDEYPHHFIMHLVHCAEIIGYKHPDHKIRGYWGGFYTEACWAFHMSPETESNMDRRLNDFGVGIHIKTENA